MRLIATCPEEAKPALVLELESLGVRHLEPTYRAVAFEASDEQFYALHLQLRTASRLLQVIKEVPAKSPPMLRSQARRIHWPELFEPTRGFLVEVVGDEGGGGMPPLQVITAVREAIRETFTAAGLPVPPVEREEPKVVVVAHLHHGRCTLSFDTAGKSLHKRGYRESGHPAPIKETLAASILLMAGYDGTQAFLDPMCGSGTLAIEAAMIAVRKAPQIHRKKGEFHFEWLKSFDRELWRTMQDRIRAEKLEATPAPVVASDINEKFIEMARAGALSARVERYMRFAVCPIQEVEPPAESGLLVTNLPYGERIGGDGDLRTLYGEIGDRLKQRFSGWRAALLAADASPYKAIGLKPSKTIRLMNGSIPCRLLVFELYAGTRKIVSKLAPTGVAE